MYCDRGYLNTPYKDSNLKLQEWCERREFVVIGWIHTHPTFDAFLSSVDQHQQFSVQVMQPKAVAIVLDQNDKPFYYRLTEHGMGVCRNCPQASEGLHVHEETAPLYQEIAVNVMTGGKRAKGYVFNEEDVMADATDVVLRKVDEISSAPDTASSTLATSRTNSSGNLSITSDATASLIEGTSNAANALMDWLEDKDMARLTSTLQSLCDECPHLTGVLSAYGWVDGKFRSGTESQQLRGLLHSMSNMSAQAAQADTPQPLLPRSSKTRSARSAAGTPERPRKRKTTEDLDIEALSGNPNNSFHT